VSLRRYWPPQKQAVPDVPARRLCNVWAPNLRGVRSPRRTRSRERSRSPSVPVSRSATQAFGARGREASHAFEKVIEKMLPTVLIVVVLVVVGYLTLRKGGRVDSVQARQLVQAGARLVDVRTPSEFAAGHIPGAINIPLQQLDSRLTELQPRETPVVVYCRSGSRSGRASRVLKSAGFAAVQDLGSMSRW